MPHTSKTIHNQVSFQLDDMAAPLTAMIAERAKMSLKIKKGREDDSDEDHDLEMMLSSKPVSDVVIKPKKSVDRLCECYYGKASHTKQDWKLKTNFNKWRLEPKDAKKLYEQHRGGVNVSLTPG